MKYINENNEFKFEYAQETITDLNDGFLSNIEGVTYQSGSTNKIDDLITKSGEEDSNESEVGSRLLSTLSTIHSIIIDHTISDQKAERNLERLERFNSVASKLSDQYAKENDLYADNFHNDVIDICQSIQVCHKQIKD